MSRVICIVGLLALLSSLVGCGSVEAIPLADTRGQQWVWPYFVGRQPTVVAFWDCDNIESIEAMPALNTLHDRDSGVQLVTVCVEPDRQRADRWLRKQRASFVVVLDPNEKLAKRLAVTSYPTYIYFNTRGEEVQRYLNIQSAWKFFDLPRFLDQGWAQSAP